jgi:hypothetical protein
VAEELANQRCVGVDWRYLDHGRWVVGVCGIVVVQCADGEECEEDAVEELRR